MRFTFVMFEGGGNVPAQLAVARRLVARGHAVRVLGDPAIAGPAAAAGCVFAAFATAPVQNLRDRDADRVRDWSVKHPMKQFERFAREVLFGPAEAYARDVLADVAQHPADALAVDCLLFGALAGAERSGIPTVQLHHMPYSVPTAGVPPFGMGFHPARGPFGRLRDRVVRAATVRMFEKNGGARLNAARGALGLPPVASVFDQLRRQDRVLVLTSRAFGFASRSALPDNVVFCGPQLDDPAWVDAWTPPWPDGAAEPLVVVALGSTFQDQGPLVQRVIDALAALPVRGLVTLGGVFTPAELRASPNVAVVASAPHRTVIPMASAVVAHGGHGTVMKALAHGKPLVCVPLGRDQADNAARVEVAGAGIRARPGASVGRLRASIERLLADRSFTVRAEAMATEIAADVAADRAVTELETLAAKRPDARAAPFVRSLVAVALCALAACGGGGGDGSPDAPNDPPVDAATDAGARPTINDVQCGPTPPIGPGNVAELQKHVLDPATFPDALCNDGTPAKLYFRPYTGAANRDKWIINLHGGGDCGGGKSCIARWCNCSNLTECPYAEVTTNFDRLNMTNAGPAQKGADGQFLRGGSGAETNPYGDWNHVDLSYCTSDTWRGRKRDLLLDAIHPQTGAPVSFTIHFLGAHVLDADFDTLRQDGTAGLVYTLGGASVPMPDLDDAAEVIITGDSAGGAGTIASLDYLADLLRANNTACQGGGACPLKIHGLIDAVVGPSWEPLDFGTFVEPSVRSYDQFLTARDGGRAAVDARVDTSCTTYHAGDPRICADDTHVIRNHITTPFFVRMALRDFLIARNYVDSGVRNPDMTAMSTASFALTLHAELSAFEAMLSAQSTAEEKAAMTRAPGVFAPGCTKHDTIHSTLDTYHTTITPPGGSPLRLFQVFEPWRAGTAGAVTNLLTQSMTLADTECP